jgi:hypothetical protein
MTQTKLEVGQRVQIEGMYSEPGPKDGFVYIWLETLYGKISVLVPETVLTGSAGASSEPNLDTPSKAERLMATATGDLSVADFSRNLADDIWAISDGASPDKDTLRAMIRARLEVGLEGWRGGSAGAASAFKCKARSANMGANDPQECDWPVCGCDPHADKVIEALQESGHLVASGSAGLRERLELMSEIVHNGQHHKLHVTDWRTCDHATCVSNRAALARETAERK